MLNLFQHLLKSKKKAFEMSAYYVYIMTNKYNDVLYTGVTNDIIRRVYEHKEKLIDGFTKKYNLCKLIYYESHQDINEAIKREKQIKNWHKDWKYNLIKGMNSDFMDLYESIIK